MKKVLLVISLVALATLAAGPNCAWAGGLGPTIAAWSIEEADNDVGFGVKWEIDLGPRWDLEVRGAHLDGYTATIDGVDFALEIFPVDLGLAYNFNKDARVGPFVGFGVSYLLLDADATVAGEPASARVRDEFGFYGVAGVEVDLVANLPRIQTVDLRLHDEIVVRYRGEPVRLEGIRKTPRRRHLETCGSPRAG